MTKKITTFFTNAGTPQTGLSATIRIWDLATNTLVVTDAAMTEIAGGFYSYDYTSYNEEKEYSIRCDGSATLTNALDRYTYAGNESYNEDLLDAQVNNHSTPGTIGAAIMGNTGAVVIPDGHGHRGNGFTKEQMELFASEVWNFMLTNDQKAQDVLISRSDFNALKDKVFLDEKNLPAKLDFKNEFIIVQAMIKETLEAVAGFDFKPNIIIPDSMIVSMSKTLSKIDEISKSVATITPAIKENTKLMDNSVEEFSDKLLSLEEQLSATNLDLSKAGELAMAITLIKDTLASISTIVLSGNTAELEKHRAILRRSAIAVSNLKFIGLTKK